MINHRTKWILSIGLCVAGLAYLGLMTWWNIHQLESMLLSLEAHSDVALPIRLHAQNTFFLMGCFAMAVIGTAVLFHRLGRRRAHLEAHEAIGRLNDELQNLSLEREQTIQHLRNEGKRWQDIVLSVPHGIFWKDIHSVFQGCNSVFARSVGIADADEIIGKTDYDLSWDRALADHFVRCDKEVLKTGIALLNLEIRHRREDKELHLLISKVPLREENRIVGLLGICVDITSQKRVWQDASDPEKSVEKIPDNLSSPHESGGETIEANRPEKEKESFEGEIDSASAFSRFNAQTHQNQPYESSLKEPAQSSSGPYSSVAGSVLIVDDVEENRMLLEVLLRKVGYRTTHAVHGKQAVEMAQREKFDVILMDMKMPVMTGLDAATQIRSHGLNQSTPILAMTASIARGDELACLEAGCDDYVRKPIKKDLVLRKIWRFVQQSRQIEQAQQGGQITSFLAEEADYLKAIESFIQKLPERIQEMQQDFEQGLLQELSLKVHSFKGLGSFAGFPIYTEKARSLEVQIADKNLDQIRIQLDELAELCRRTQIKSRP
ncbi:MAG: response regulator [Sedimentisphaerales bacterium]|nr:response regulator [Sedimentisphaerales bacterium]